MSELSVESDDDAPRIHDGIRRRALCAGLGTFDDLPPLPFAGERTGKLIGSLSRLGYDCTWLDPGTPAEKLGEAIDTAINNGGTDGVLIVHVLSHGIRAETGHLQVIGSDGVPHRLTDVERWLLNVSNFRESAPTTLFLLDICYSGKAARFDWQTTKVTAANRAWVISACGPMEMAYGGRFTEAIANVLDGLAEGTLDIDPSYRNAPLPTIAQKIRQEVARLAPIETSLPQQVTASLIDISSEPPDVAFFPNVAYAENPRRRIRPRVDVAIAPFLDDLDEALDPEHFATRASGKGFSDTGGEGFFSGRSQELKTLAPWINLQDDVGLRVLTGSPGAGKSALIGILVCAAHPVLREPTRPVWDHVEQAPYRNEVFAAVHARQRSLDEIVTSVARQLGVDASDADALVQAVTELAEPPVIVVDALDEAADGRDVMERLLLPLARIKRADGEPVRLLVGMRPWPEFAPLRTEAEEHGRVTDLDAVTAVRLRRDVQQYISRLLVSDERWDKIEYEGAAHTLARAMAETLTARGTSGGWGAFLVAGLFTHHVLTAYPEPLRDVTEAAGLGKSAPRTLPELLDLDLQVRADNPLLRPVLAALSHARGEGMPAEIIRHASIPFIADGQPADPATLLKALEAARFYLRHSVEVDGTTRYRLFHQGLADHLHEADKAGAVLDALLPRRWDLAEPYVLRHAADHAAEAGRVRELIRDGGYLVACEPADLFDHVGAELENPVVRAYRAAVERGYPEDVEGRRTVLAFAAAEMGAADLRTAMAELAYHEPMTWVPDWTLGVPGEARISAIGPVDVHGEPALLVARQGWPTVALLDCADGREIMWLEHQNDGEITALAGGTAWGWPIVGFAVGEKVRVLGATYLAMDVRLETGSEVRQIAFAEFGGRPAVVATGPTDATMWDLETGQRLAVLEVNVLGLASARIGDKLVEVHGPTDERPHPVVLENNAPVDLDDDGPLVAASVGVFGDRIVVCTGHRDGVLRAWDPWSWEVVDQITIPNGIAALHADEHGHVIVVRPDDIVMLRHLDPATQVGGLPDRRPRIGSLSFAYASVENPDDERAEPAIGRASVPDGAASRRLPNPDETKQRSGLPALGPGPMSALDRERRAGAQRTAEELRHRSTLRLGRAIGIDLGSAKVAAAVVRSGSPVILDNAEGARTTPSVVAVSPDGDVLVGEVARRQAVTNPDRTVRPVKREIGGDQAIDLDGSHYSPRAIWAELLIKLKYDAEERLGVMVTQAVLTVPSTFDEIQRETLRLAAAAAGLHVPFLISSATATALAYALDKAVRETTILVFDLGGGTLDVSLLELGGGVIEVRSTAGDDHLGGDDWDLRIVDHLISEFREEHDIDLRTDRGTMERLREAAEKAKIELSAATTADITLPYIAIGLHGPLTLRLTLSRAQFQQMTQDLLERTMGPFQEAIRRAGITVADVDQVVLAGGSSRMPAVTHMVMSLTGKEPSRGVNPDEAAAAGAAIKAAVLAGEVKDVMLLDVTPHALGIGTEGGVNTVLIRQGSTLPTRHTALFTTAGDDQSSALIRIFQGERLNVEDNTELGVFEVTDLPPGARIEVTMDVEADGRVHVSAGKAGTGAEQRMTIAGGAAIPRQENA